MPTRKDAKLAVILPFPARGAAAERHFLFSVPAPGLAAGQYVLILTEREGQPAELQISPFSADQVCDRESPQ